MAIFLDSVDLSEVRQAMRLGFVAGITTNPLLMAKAGRRAHDIIRELVDVSQGIVFHQLMESDALQMQDEAERYLSIGRGRVGLKVPCSLEGARLVHSIHDRAICAVTAVYSPAQAYLFAEAGARYVIPYVNRAARQGIDAVGLVEQLARVVTCKGGGCEVLAASLKSSDEAATAIMAGARHLTVPWAVLAMLADHPLTQQALAEFGAVTRQ